jgi:hypothetical protein
VVWYTDTNILGGGKKNCYLQLQVKAKKHHIPEDCKIKKSLFKFYVSQSSRNS